MVLLVSLLGFQSCHEDSIEETTVIDTIEPAIFYRITVEGIVSDIEGNPIIDAIVHFDGKEESTDSLGYFKLEDVEASSQGTWLKATAMGFLTAGKRIDVLFSGEYHVTIVMNEEPSTTTFSASEGTILNVDGISSVTFSAEAFSLNGVDYTENVYAKAMALSPDNPRLADLMPGDLIGLNRENQVMSLQSYGMIYVSLSDDTGNEVKLSEGNPARITMDIPVGMQSNAPNQIPLWHFDEDSGYWIEEGVAQKNGNIYEAEVSHFSWWNIDVPLGEMTTVCLTMRDAASGNPLPFANVEVSVDNFLIGFLLTNEDGFVCEQFPIETDIQLTVFNECGTPQDNITVGPFTEVDNNATVDFEYYSGDEISISGTFQNCNGDAIAASYAVITSGYDRTPISIQSDGSFELLFSCSAPGEELTITALDSESQMTGTSSFIIEENVSEYVQTVDVCGSSTFFVYHNGTEDLFYSDCIVVQNPNEIIIACNNNTCIFGIEGTTVGQFNGAISCDLPVTDVNYSITELGTYISGSFDKNEINGDFRVKL